MKLTIEQKAIRAEVLEALDILRQHIEAGSYTYIARQGLRVMTVPKMQIIGEETPQIFEVTMEWRKK